MNDRVKFAELLMEIMESENVKFIFGHPGEQILPLYEALRKSKIKHVLMRHEQGAAHAAETAVDLVEAAAADHELAQDERGPPVAEELGANRDGTVLAIRGHGAILSRARGEHQY